MAMPRVRMVMPRSVISKANEWGTAVPPVEGGSDVAVGIGMGVGSGAPRLPAATSVRMRIFMIVTMRCIVWGIGPAWMEW